ncbi:MAG TPA: MFS transporter, partial [Thermoleophilia bacterium]|nr:MFS transporter [Thermoleophilia bacterium]
GLLMPESRSEERPRLDLAGVFISSAGLTALTYGLIEAGQHGWSDAGAVFSMIAGAALLAGFVLWERRVTGAGDRPLVDLTLFRSSGFTWGTVLATLVSFAMFGLLFTMPTFFQAVGGADAFGSGPRLLPLVGGLIAGAVTADRLAARAGAKVTVAIGFALLAGGLLLGSSTSVRTGYGFTGLWMTMMGAGLGFALPAAMDAALGALSPERSGVGSGLIMALRQVGGTFGVAILGSILNGVYRGRLQLQGLPDAVAGAVRDGVASGVAVAHQAQSVALLGMVRLAFVHAMDVMLVICALVAATGVVLALAFLPRRSTVAAGEHDAQTGGAAHDEAGPASPARPSPPIAAPGAEGAESAHAGGR